MSAVAASVILDISRLISRVRYSTPSGVDRVEMAYARGLRARYGAALAFAAVHPCGLYGRIAPGAAIGYLDALEHRWSRQDDQPRRRALLSVLPRLAALLPARVPAPEPGAAPGAVYVQASPHHLTDVAKVRRILARERARFVCLVHDLIPIEYPEYARPSGAARHRRRIATVAALADAVIVNSAATGAALRPWLADRPVPVRVALLGTEPLPPVPTPPPPPPLPLPLATAPDARPSFICLGTIEPRKNHLLLLHLWRDLARTLPAAAVPRLIVIGRRGWENEQVIDLLDRCPALTGHVQELGGCSDARLAALLRGARALLLPSFAEGYGMPVAEALAAGVPVICADLPALREAGGAVPDYLDPLDGAGWRAAILDHAARGPRHAAQLARLPAWRAPTWDDHLAIVAETIAGLAAGRSF